MKNSERIIFIVGPTAIGKSEVAVTLAEKIQGEIISCDAMQVYKEVSIASNKPSQSTLRRVTHHLIDIISVKDEYNVARFNEMAHQAIKTIHQRKHVPVIVGGSGLYMQILLDGIFLGGGKSEDLRNDLKQKAQAKGNDFIYEWLHKEDPVSAKKIHPNDIKKVIRALEVCLAENKPLAQLKENRKGLWGTYDIKIFALNRPRDELYGKINQRTQEMFDQGLIEEVKGLSDAKMSLTAQSIIGIREVQGYLAQQYDLQRAQELIQRNTRRYAKRQLTWFRKDKRLRWIMISENDTIEDIVTILSKGINEEDGKVK